MRWSGVACTVRVRDAEGWGACCVRNLGEAGTFRCYSSGKVRAGKGVLNVHHMKKRSCITRERCTGYPPLSPDSSSSFVSADLWGRGVLLVEGVIGLVVCLGVAATGGGVTLGGLPQPAAGGGGWRRTLWKSV